ncbi:hypothetical protein K450DRAFT_232130 [Umbelopsis ramanniana AG]|uniref:Uncharacterized protein n=1 Tax=Umbelopsis ramanniana AG TaxID=1314678 RepID=A0AAD5HGC3_UMBRA|nr:uncharacterized protein K450DRAFT_232130 [Umbelopsis ramanniana AG]KAI8581611.1 hypothetical protein K450DRAFT_232130 [Umbelopsis ramanniana AG]
MVEVAKAWLGWYGFFFFFFTIINGVFYDFLFFFVMRWLLQYVQMKGEILRW